MFGDNMSIISDTTIAAIATQEANLKDKLKLNIIIALISAGITIVILLFNTSLELNINNKPFSFALMLPYVFLIVLATCGVNVFVTLVISLVRGNWNILQ